MKTLNELVEYVMHKSEYKLNTNLFILALLAFMAGVMISLGAVGNIVVAADLVTKDAGLAKFVGASVFPVGLIVIVLLSYELFTSNCMNISAVYEKKSNLFVFILKLIYVLFFNLIGCLFIGYITVRTHTFSASAVTYLGKIAEHKANATGYEIFLKGILCNVLVCGATLCAYAAKDGVSKIFGIWFPIMLFIVLGYDHVVANMLYLPTAYMLHTGIKMGEMVHNLFFAGIGNFVGGAFVAFTPLYLAYIYNGEKNAKN